MHRIALATGLTERWAGQRHARGNVSIGPCVCESVRGVPSLEELRTVVSHIPE